MMGMRLVSGVTACLLGAAMGQATAHAAGRAAQGETGVAPGEAPQAKDELLAGTEKFAQGATDVTDVNLDRNMLGAIRGREKEAANRLNFIVVHSYTYDKPGKYSMDEVESYQKKLMRGDWNCFIHVRERKSGEATDICKRDSAGDNHELVIITAEPKELTFVHLSGKLPLGDLQSLGQLGSLGMLMAIPPEPPVPPVPPVPGVPGVPPAPAAPAPASSHPTKLQKEGMPLSEAERAWMTVVHVTARIQPRLEMAVQRANFQIARAETQEMAAIQRDAGPTAPSSMGVELAELMAMDRPWQVRVQQETDGAEQEARQRAEQNLEEQTRAFREQMKAWQSQMPKIDARALQEQARQVQEQMKAWQSQRPQMDAEALREQTRQLQEQMRQWQNERPRLNGESGREQAEELQRQLQAWQSHRPKIEEKELQAQMDQFQAQMKQWQSQMPKMDEQKLQEQMQQFNEQMKAWQSHRPEWDRQLQEQMRQLQKQRQELRKAGVSAERTA